MKQVESNHIKLITKKLNDACLIEFGTRVVQKKDGGAIYSVYGGGGATFKMDIYNRENCLVVSRFAMSKKCTRFVSGKFYLNDSGLTVKPKNINELRQEYLDYLLLALNDTIYSLSRGTAQRNLNVSKFRNIEIQYPYSIDTQLHIADILSKAEILIAQRKESIRLLDEFLKSTFLEMFGDVNRMKDMKTEPLLNYIDFLTSGSRGWAKYYSESGAKFLRIQNVWKGSLRIDDMQYVTPPSTQEAIRTKTKEGDLLITITADLGRTAVVPKSFGEAYINQHIALVRLKNQINPVFASFFYFMPFGFSAIQKKNKSAVKAGLTFNDIRSLPIIVPPTELQTQFAQIVEKTEALKAQYQQSLQELENLYGSLSQRAFRGELSLKNERN